MKTSALTPLSLLAFLFSAGRCALGQAAVGAPDALVMVAPFRERATISITFARPLPHRAVRRVLDAMARSGGWRIEGAEVRDEAASASGSRDLGKQTVAEVRVVGPPQVSGGGLVLQPYLHLLEECSRIEVLFLVPADPSLVPLRSLEAGGVAVRLVRAGGPYHYVVERQEGRGPLPKLPLTEAARSDGFVSEAEGGLSRPVAIGLGSGALAAVVVFALVRRAQRTARRAR